MDFRTLIDSAGHVRPAQVMQIAHQIARMRRQRYGDATYAVELRDALITAWARAREQQGIWQVRNGTAPTVQILMPVVDGIAHERRV